VAERLKIWFCKIGEVHPDDKPDGADEPMREAVARTYKRITGCTPVFIFSGWGGELNEEERAVVDDREPVYEKTEYARRQQVDELVRAAREFVSGTGSTPFAAAKQRLEAALAPFPDPEGEPDGTT
jgi:hypothetical protein